VIAPDISISLQLLPATTNFLLAYPFHTWYLIICRSFTAPASASARYSRICASARQNYTCLCRLCLGGPMGVCAGVNDTVLTGGMQMGENDYNGIQAFAATQNA